MTGPRSQVMQIINGKKSSFLPHLITRKFTVEKFPFSQGFQLKAKQVLRHHSRFFFPTKDSCEIMK